MTPKEILKMAADVLLTDPDLGEGMTDYGDSTESILALAYLIVKAERAELIQLTDSCGYVSVETLQRRGASSQPEEEKVTHTPGPWKLIEDDYGDEYWFGGFGEGQITVNGWVNGGYRTCDPKKWRQAQVDAKLMAAAPELLEALQELLRECGEGIATSPLTRDKARAAIAKAT